jgi:hypothetical protein
MQLCQVLQALYHSLTDIWGLSMVMIALASPPGDRQEASDAPGATNLPVAACSAAPGG